MLQADGSLGAEVAAEVGACPGVGAAAVAQGPTGCPGGQGPRDPAGSSPAQAEKLWGAKPAGWAGRSAAGPRDQRVKPLAPGHVARGGAQAAPAPRGCRRAASFRALIVGQERLHPPVQGPRGA